MVKLAILIAKVRALSTSVYESDVSLSFYRRFTVNYVPIACRFVAIIQGVEL